MGIADADSRVILDDRVTRHVACQLSPVRQALLCTLIAFVLLFCATPRAEQDKLKTWDAEAIARLSGQTTRLLDGPGGEAITTVNVEKVRRLVDVKNRIANAANQQAKLVIVSGAEPNAFATKQNGSPLVAVNLAMMNLLGEDYDAYAAIMGHEVAHLTLNHGDIRQQREGVRTVASSLLGLVLGRYGVPMGGTIADVSTTVVSRAFSREDESAADRLGVTYMREAGFDPSGAVRAWERMASTSKSRGLPFLSTHPAPQERLEEMKQLAAQGPKIVVASARSSSPDYGAKPSPERVDKASEQSQTSSPPPSRVEVDTKQALAVSRSANANIGLAAKQAQPPRTKSAAVEYAENAVAQDPSNAIAWYRLGAAHLDEQSTDKAIQSFEEALKLNPKFSEAIFGLGTAYQQMGKHEQVDALYPRLRKGNPQMAKLYFKMYLLP